MKRDKFNHNIIIYFLGGIGRQDAEFLSGRYDILIYSGKAT